MSVPVLNVLPAMGVIPIELTELRVLAAMTACRLLRPRSFCSVLLFGLLFFLFQPLPVAAQGALGNVSNVLKEDGVPVVKPKADGISTDELKKRLAEVQVSLAAVDSPDRLASGAPPGTPVPDLQLRARMLRLMAFSYRQHLNALATLSEKNKLFADAEAKRLAWSGVPEKPPYSILLVDSMRAELQANLLNLRSEEVGLKIVVALEESAKGTLAKSNERYRLAQEALEAAKPDDIIAATWRRDLAALEVKAQGIYLQSLAARSRLSEASVAESGRAVEFLRRNLGEVEKSVVFRIEDLERLKSDIEERRSATIKELDRASRERERLSGDLDKAISAGVAAEKRVIDVQEGLAKAHKLMTAAGAEVAKLEQSENVLQKINPWHGRSAKAELDNRRKALAELEKSLAAARRFAVLRERERLLAVERSLNAVHAIEVLSMGLVILDMQRSFWDLRYSAIQEKNTAGIDRRKMNEGSRRLLEIINPTMEYMRGKLEVVVGQIAEQQNLLRLAADASEISFRKAMMDLVTERERLFLAEFSRGEEARHLLLRWFEEEEIRAKNLTPGERAQNGFDLTAVWLRAAWSFELFAVEDSIVVEGKTITGTRGITVAKVVQAILIVVFGYLLVALLTRFSVGIAMRRGQLDETTARIARKWILAVALLVLLLLALNVVKIPLAAFAFLGGAIAIGAGFGMQTLLKNLISGVMLLMERPFKPRDIIEVGGIRGEVTDINVRSCTIRDVNGIETLVPNSTFLEQNVTNWTLSNRKVRYTLNIGVGYGSSVRKVSDLLLEVASRHNQVLAEPAPEVLFMDFSDNALMFSLYIWLEVGPGRRGGSVILSDLRFMIDTSFADHGITLPYPQRDVHLDANSPVPVRVVATE